MSVVQRVATWLQEIGVQTVVDIGSGAGKFCVVSALLTRCRFVGLEQRASLVSVARDLAETFGVSDRVSFIHGSFSAESVPAADAYYLFNPFGEYIFETSLYDEPGVSYSDESYEGDVGAAFMFLSHAPAGTFVITLNGYGGKFPRTYEQIDIGLGLPGTLRLWKKG